MHGALSILKNLSRGWQVGLRVEEVLLSAGFLVSGACLVQGCHCGALNLVSTGSLAHDTRLVGRVRKEIGLRRMLLLTMGRHLVKLLLRVLGLHIIKAVDVGGQAKLVAGHVEVVELLLDSRIFVLSL